MRDSLPEKLDAAYDADRFAADRAASLSLPTARFDVCKPQASVAVSQRSLVCLEGATYSVLCEWAGIDITARVGVDEVVLV